ncbi:MAG TPA: carboxypeptidase regulatory-like domain-containing protein, partial [Bryobacteraceae bacterium]
MSVLAILPSLSAQSTISGVVTDPSGSVIPGVRVEASSAALIEKSRTVTTDGQGRYAIFDVRPGTYALTFTADGFNIVKRDQIEVPSNVTVNVSTALTVGSVSQTMEVQATAPVVDVENVAHPAILSRSDMDALPTGRYMQSIGSYVPGVHLNIPDIGGSQQTEQNVLSAHGNNYIHSTYLLDGMLINTNLIDGGVQNYVDNSMIEETTYSTTNFTAEVSSGGVLINLVPKTGGNTFHGQFYAGGSAGSWQASNISSALVARNAPGILNQDAVDRIEDFDGSLGGPIKKDKLWFLMSGRKQVTYTTAGTSVYPNGAEGIQDAWIWVGSLRLTWSPNSKNKFTAMDQRNWKTKLHEILDGHAGPGVGIPVNPATDSTRRDPVMYYIAQVKWTGTLTPKLLLEAGYSIDKLDYYDLYQTGINQAPFTPDWYRLTSIYDAGRNTRTVAGFYNAYVLNTRNVETVRGAYVTGSHQFKFGQTWDWGPADSRITANGDGEIYNVNGTTLGFLAYNTPLVTNQHLNADIGIYGQDTWHYKRLSITAGIRFEYLKSTIEPESAPAGRFVGTRNTAAISCDQIPGLGCWKTWHPRVGLVYDVFGKGKTAVKAGFGKYNSPQSTGFLTAFNPIAFKSTFLTQTNATSVPINSPNATFTTPLVANWDAVNTTHLDKNYKREYNLQYSLGVQHQLFPRVGLNFSWYRRSNYQSTLTLNTAVPGSAWTQTSAINPLDGSTFPIYNLKSQFVGLPSAIYQTNAPRSLVGETYIGYETSVQARLKRGAFVYGGWTVERDRTRNCAESSASLNDPNTLRFCDMFGNLFQDSGQVPGVPFRHEFMVTGSTPLYWKVNFGVSLYSNPYPGTAGPENDGFTQVFWSVTNTTKYPARCIACTPGAVVDPNLAAGQTETLP